MIRLEGISVRFGRKLLFENLDLDVAKGEKVIIRGKSGSGKTTILRLILGFTKPESGKVIINHKLLDHDNVWQLRRLIGFVSQDTDIGEGTVEDFFLEISGFKSNKQIGKPEKYLSRFGLDKSYLDKNIEDLSGGEKQRVSIIAGLMLNRDVMLLDEITSALDKSMKNRVVDYFYKSKKTIIAISHDEAWLSKGARVISI